MNKINTVSQQHNYKTQNPVWIILSGALLVTLYFNIGMQDPFNSPKMWVLLLLSAWLCGYLLTNIKVIKSEQNLKLYGLVVLSFTLTALMSTLLTDNQYTAFIGETQRRNGFLTYFALAIVGLSSAIYIRINVVKRIYIAAFVTGFALAVYGLMQNFGADFVNWNNPYNSIISTVGNPNFAAAIMAMMATIIFGPVLNSSFSLIYRIICLTLTLVLLTTIYLSDALQGLISMMIGIGFYVIVWLYQINKKLGLMSAGFSSVFGIFSILGMLQIGPLTSLLYKSSVTLRGYYWQAGLKMFTDNPLTGVGFDRYGAYFKDYRDLTYPLKYGFNITSSNAHNLPIQMFATGGFFVGLAYLALTLYILFVGIKSIKNSTGNNRLLIASIFSSWLAYQAQSIISIDNIGISIWGWLLGGAIIGLSIATNTNINMNSSRKARKNDLSLVQPIVSMTFSILVVLLISTLYRVEVNMFDTRARFNPQVQELKQPLIEFSEKTLSTNLLDPNYKVIVATYLIEAGFIDRGVTALKEVHLADPQNFDALFYLAEFYQKSGDASQSRIYREKISEIDPWNSYNYLQLGIIYKSLGELDLMDDMLSKIRSFDSVSSESKSASTELKRD
jgi:O-antigen ligase